MKTKRDIYIATGIVGDTFNKDEIKFEVTRDSKDGEFEANKTVTFLIGNSDIANYTHQEVEVYVAEDDGEYTVLAVKAAKKTETFTKNYFYLHSTEFYALPERLNK